MDAQVGWRTRISIGVLIVYRLSDSIIRETVQLATGTIPGMVASLVFDPLVNWSLFLLVVYVATDEIRSIIPKNKIIRVTIAASATAYAFIWYSMYFRFTGPLPPTVEQSALRILAITIVTVILLNTGASISVSRVGTITVGCFALGLVGGILSGLTPVPELLILGWLLWTGMSTLSSASQQSNLSLESIDLEERLLGGIIASMRNEKGRYALIIVLTGFVTAVIFFLVFPAIFYIDYGGEISPSGLIPLVLVAIPFTIYAAYGGWFWLRTLQRIPFFLSDTDNPHKRPVTRPIGMFVPGSIFIGGLLSLDHSVLLGIGGLVIGLGAIIWSIKSTRGAQSQSASTEQYAIPIALIVQFLSLSLLNAPNTHIPLIILPAVFFLPEARGKFPKIVNMILTLCIVVLFVGLLWPLTVNRLLAITVLPAEVAIVAALFQSGVKYAEHIKD